MDGAFVKCAFRILNVSGKTSALKLNAERLTVMNSRNSRNNGRPDEVERERERDSYEIKEGTHKKQHKEKTSVRSSSAKMLRGGKRDRGGTAIASHKKIIQAGAAGGGPWLR